MGKLGSFLGGALAGMVGLGLASYLVVKLSESPASCDADGDETSENSQPDAANTGA